MEKSGMERLEAVVKDLYVLAAALTGLCQQLEECLLELDLEKLERILRFDSERIELMRSE